MLRQGGIRLNVQVVRLPLTDTWLGGMSTKQREKLVKLKRKLFLSIHSGARGRGEHSDRGPTMRLIASNGGSERLASYYLEFHQSDNSVSPATPRHRLVMR